MKELKKLTGKHLNQFQACKLNQETFLKKRVRERYFKVKSQSLSFNLSQKNF